jgi:hypothetical protein
MSDLATCLAAVAADLQSGAAYQLAPSASLDELIDALRVVPLSPSAEDHLIDELVARGIGTLDAIEQALLADALAPLARRLGETLVQLYQREPSVRARVVATLIDAASRALDAGGSTRETSSFFLQLADCATIDGPLPEAEPVARRLLAIADGEVDPYPAAVHRAQRLLGPTARRAARPRKPRSKTSKRRR